MYKEITMQNEQELRAQSEFTDPNIKEQEVAIITPQTPAQPTAEVAEETMPTALAPTEGANVRLSRKKWKEALPAGVTMIGRHKMEVPELDQQLGGFKVENAGVLVDQFSQYKFYVPKGEPVPNTTK
jgi:hypothetical protein